MSEQKNEDYGIVYALINEAMPGLVKIGISSNTVEMRKDQLYFGCSGVPLPFECVYACKVKDYKKAEKALHVVFAPDRINPNREFFKIEIERVIAILELLGPNNAKREIEEELDRDVSSEEIKSREKMKKRAAFNFEKMGIPIGTKLSFTKDSSIKIEVVKNNKVKYNGNIMSLTAATRQFIPYVVHPTPYWIYEDEKLSDIWIKSLEED